MSFTLLLICRRSVGVSIRSPLLRSFPCSSRTFIAESSTLKSKYGSLKPSPAFESPFREPTDDKSRRLKLQEQIQFREKFRLESDYGLIYAMPKQRLFGLMHFLCTCGSVMMFSFVAIHFHQEMLDIEPSTDGLNQQIPPWALYSVATVLGFAFGSILVLISRMPVRLYYSPVRQSYALFYHPVIGIFRQKKILYHQNQYKIVPQKLDNVDGPQQSIKIRIEQNHGLLRLKNSFYFIEAYFRSKRDVHRVRMKDIADNDDTIDAQKSKDQQPTQKETDIWETVVEQKDQDNSKRRSTQRKTFL